jgi:hypothetical protein
MGSEGPLAGAGKPDAVAGMGKPDPIAGIGNPDPIAGTVPIPDGDGKPSSRDRARSFAERLRRSR